MSGHNARWPGGDAGRAARTLATPLVALALALGLPAGAAAQDPGGLSFVIGLGYEDGGPGPALIDALHAVDLDGVKPGTCAGAICQQDVQHPFYFAEGLNLTVLVGFRYRFEAPFSIETLLSNGRRGHAEGYEPENREHLIVSHASFLGRSTVGVHLGPVRLGAGPAVNITGWEATHDAANTTKTTTATVGGTAGLSWSVEVGDVRLALRGSYQRFPETQVDNPLRLPIGADYDSFLIGLTVNPRAP